jgi:hypothetical protein
MHPVRSRLQGLAAAAPPSDQQDIIARFRQGPAGTVNPLVGGKVIGDGDNGYMLFISDFRFQISDFTFRISHLQS